jgi:ligand-binding sensor domain-containing protein
MKTFLYTLLFFLLVTQICFAQWVQTNGFYGGNISALVTDGINLYAGTVNGVYISTNNGSNWTPINSGLPSGLEISDLAIDGDNLFVGTSGMGIFRTTNNGISWSEANSGLPQNAFVNTISVSTDKIGGSKLYACVGIDDSTHFFGSTCIYLSLDNGLNWKAISTQPITFITSLVSVGENIFIGASWGEGLIRLSQNDTSWTVDRLISNLSVNSLAVTGTNLFAGTDIGILLSTDSGESWTSVNSGLPTVNIVYKLAVSESNILAQVGFYMPG